MNDERGWTGLNAAIYMYDPFECTGGSVMEISCTLVMRLIQLVKTN